MRITKRIIAATAAISLTVASFPGGVIALAAGQEDGRQENGDAARASVIVDETEPIPPQVQFSKESGVYGEAFDLELSFENSDAVVYYTLDGSDPSDASNERRQAYSAEGIAVRDRKGDANVLSAIDPILFDAVNVGASSDGKDFVSTVEKPADEDVDKCTVVKAVAEYPDGTCSDVITNTYFVGDIAEHIEGIRESSEAAGKKLAVISISMDANDLFDSTKGIYVKGDVFNQALAEYVKDGGRITDWKASDICRGMDANYKQKGKGWERKTHIDYFESDGQETSCEFQQDCGIRIQGNYSRSDYQKSFRLYARDEYGAKNFKYGFWDDAVDDNGDVIKKYKKVVLRNGGNCAFTTKFSDSYWQALMEDIDCDTQSARPCVVYLNGEYWGVYILQDDFCGAFMENKHGVNKDDVVIYKGDAEAIRDLGYKLDEGELPAGEENENYYFRELEEFMSAHDDLSSQEDYEAFADLVDVDSALDYFATEVWINNKWDWPGKNWSMWKSTVIDENNPYADGRWRFLIYDVEFGGISGSSDIRENTVENSRLLETGTAEYGDSNYDKPNVRCFALLMTNKDFRERFIERLESFSDGMFERQRMTDVANQFKDMYQPILQQFFDRFPTEWNGSKKTAAMVINGNGGDTYGTWKNIVTFLKGRANYIPKIAEWIREQYEEIEPTVSPTTEPTITPVVTESPEPSPGTGSPLPSPSAPAPTQSAAAPVPSSPAETAVSNPTAKPSDITTVERRLSDGTIEITEVDRDGKVFSTRYNVDGLVYLLKGDNTFCYEAQNKSALKKESVATVPGKVTAGGRKYKVTEIEAAAFKGLTKLKRVTIGENITVIGKGAFQGCKNLKRIDIKTKKLKSIGTNAIKGVNSKAVIKCPKGKKKAYKKLFTGKSGYKKKTMQLV